MAFSFDFDENDEPSAIVSGNGPSPLLDHPKASNVPQVHSARSLLDRLPERIAYSSVDIGNDRVYRREVWDVKVQFMAEEDDHEKIDNFLGEKDLISGAYEGGVKTWECSVDLSQILGSYDIAHINTILELGCGSALPTLTLFRRILKQNNTDKTFVCQDYNHHVLEYLTVPNLFLNWFKTCREPDESIEGEVLIDQGLRNAFEKSLDEFKVSLSFVSGGWGTEMTSEICTLCPKIDVILASETIYSLETFPVFLGMIKELLGRSPKSSRLVLASKLVYFGVGGSISHYLSAAQDLSLVNTKLGDFGQEGVGRVVYETRAMV